MTFTPDLSDLYLTMGLSGLAFALLVFVALRANKYQHPDPRYRVLVPMLAYFAALLALMVFLGGFWSTTKFPTVVVANNQLTIDEAEYRLPRTGDVRIEQFTAGGSLGRGGRMLLVQTQDRRTWAFPEGRYDIDALYVALGRGRGGKR